MNQSETTLAYKSTSVRQRGQNCLRCLSLPKNVLSKLVMFVIRT